MKNKLLLFLILIGFTAHSQDSPNLIDTTLSPNGVLENVFDHYGNKYKLSDIIVGKDVRNQKGQLLRGTNPTPMTCGYYNLYFEAGSGMENTSNAEHMARRAVVCQVFTDLSNFINTPLTTNGLNNRVNIWVRNINNVIVPPASSLGVPGLASSFYSMPYNTTAGFGGIVDNEVWKTIHTGVDSYTNVVSPLVSSGISSGTSGIFYHGMMAFNFTDTTTPINWNTNLSIASFPNLYDLYSVVLHEVVHSLGFASLINSTGTSKLNSGYSYFTRYDRFLKNKENTQFLLTGTGCGTGKAGSMYNYMFNPLLDASVLQPGIASCTNSIRYVGTSNVQVYTPSVFDPPSSLSHFDGTCITPNPSFVLSSSIGTNVIRRFLRSQERNALADIGYSVNTTYGVSTTYQGTTTYAGVVLNGIPIAGINDGINLDGTFKYVGNASSAIVINSPTDPTIRILSNDTNTATNFECLQDVFDATATFSTTSGTSTSNITFTSAIPGLHLLRYVPRNSAGTQKGNITYIYVYLEADNFCGSPPTACDLVINGDFESHIPFVSNGHLGNIANACNWSDGHNIAGAADYYNSDYGNVGLRVPCNMSGYEPDKIIPNHGYAGTLIKSTSGSPFYIEPIKTKLLNHLLPNTNYQLSFDASLSERYSKSAAKLQAYLSDTFTTYPGYGEIPITNPTMLFTSPTTTTTTNGWEKIIFNFTTSSSASENVLYVGGITTQINPLITQAPLGVGGCAYLNPPIGENMAYYFIDNVSLIPLNGGSFTLPNTICQQQILSNLNTYLDGLPTNGVFSGAGVTNIGGVYSLNTTSVPFGVNTISYTYTNSSGCSVTIYSNITIEDCGCHCLSTMNFTYTNVGNTVTFNVLNTNPNCSLSSVQPLRLVWEFGDGTTVFNGGSTVTHTYPTSGSYLVKLSARIMSPVDEVICSRSGRNAITNTVVTSSGRYSVDLINQSILDNVSIYPNPSTSKFNIKINNNINKEILVVVRTIEGKEILRKSYFSQKGNPTLEVEMPDGISDGLVLVEISSSDFKIIKNLIIKH